MVLRKIMMMMSCVMMNLQHRHQLPPLLSALRFISQFSAHLSAHDLWAGHDGGGGDDDDDEGDDDDDGGGGDDGDDDDDDDDFVLIWQVAQFFKIMWAKKIHFKMFKFAKKCIGCVHQRTLTALSPTNPFQKFTLQENSVFAFPWTASLILCRH